MPKQKSSSSVSSYEPPPLVFTALDIAKFLAKSESNMEVIQDSIDGYRGSQSHKEIVEKIYTLLFDYKGYHAELKILGKYAEERDLTAKENVHVAELESNMNEMIGKYNEILP